MGNIGSPAQTVTKTTNAVLVLPKTLPLVQRKQTKTIIDVRRAMSACCQCSYCTSLCPRHLLGHPIDPSALMNAAAHNVTSDTSPFINAFFCSSCGLCEAYSCNQGLSPRSLLTATKTSLRQKGVKPPQNPDMRDVEDARPLRMIPLSRLRGRLGLEPYNKSAPITEEEVKVKRLVIQLSQHIGAPAEAVVKKGDKVTGGQLIAKPKDEALSVGIHTPLGGTVTDVTNKNIIISVE